MLWLSRPRRGAYVMIATLVVVPVVRAAIIIWFPGLEEGIERGLISALDGFAAGGLLAILRHRLERHDAYMRVIRAPGVMALMPLALILNLFEHHPVVFYVLLQPVIYVMLAFCLHRSQIAPDNAVGQVLNWRPLAWLGSISYSLYLWQQPFLAPAGRGLLHLLPGRHPALGAVRVALLPSDRAAVPAPPRSMVRPAGPDRGHRAGTSDGARRARAVSMRVLERPIVASLLRSSGILAALERASRERSLFVLNYHRVGTIAGNALDDATFSASAEDLRLQMTYLKRWFVLPPVDQILDSLARGRFDEPTALVTFDDGYRDNYELGFPVLRSLGVPACFFVVSGYVDTPSLPWWDRDRLFGEENRRRASSRSTTRRRSSSTCERCRDARVTYRILRAYKRAQAVGPAALLRRTVGSDRRRRRRAGAEPRALRLVGGGA